MTRERISKTKYIASVVIYGTSGLMLRYISFPSEIVAVVRGVLGTMFLLLYLLCRGQRLDRAAIRRNLLWLVLSGVSLGLNWVFLFEAYRHTTVAVASLCNYMAPIIILFLSPFLFRERLSGRKLLCILAALIGIVLVSGVQSGAQAAVNGHGILFGLAAALGFVGIVLFNKQLRDIPALDKSVMQLAISALAVLPYAILANRGVVIQIDTLSIYMTIIFGIVHTGMAYCLYFGAMGEISVQAVAILGYIEPVVSVLCSTLILGEFLPFSGWIGAVLILGAAVVSELVE